MYRKQQILNAVILAALFIAALTSYMKFSLWDFDFWWHIATGRYIVEHGALPAEDPFTFTNTMEENRNIFPEREQFILRQYWLAQILMFKIFNLFGPAGIIMLRSAILASIVLLAGIRLRRWGVSMPVALIFSFGLLITLRMTIGERPVLFTLLFFQIIFFLLEEYREKKGMSVFLMIPCMIVWANMHGGFILGDILIAAYLADDIIQAYRKGTPIKSKERLKLITAGAGAIALSLINPTGGDAFLLAFSSKYDFFYRNTQEYQSLFSFITQKIWSPNIARFLFVALYPIIALFRFRHISLANHLLLFGTFCMGLISIRYLIFFNILCVQIIGRECDAMVQGLFRKRFSVQQVDRLGLVLTVFALVSLLFFSVAKIDITAASFDVAKGSTVPEKAVDFMTTKGIAGNIFNEYAYGGYIAWRLYPDRRTFVDTRALNLATNQEYDWIINATLFAPEVNPSMSNRPLWQRLLDHYQINVVVIPTLDLYSQVQPLLLVLTGNKGWAPVYADTVSVMFVRRNEQNRPLLETNELASDDVYQAVIVRAGREAISNKVNPRALISLAEIFYRQNKYEEALKAYQHALERDVDNTYVKEQIKELQRMTRKPESRQ